MESEFNNIIFREDCYDYLVGCGMPEDSALNLTRHIRTGRFRFLKDTDEYDVFLEKAFINWAKGVQYLPYRENVWRCSGCCIKIMKTLSQ